MNLQFDKNRFICSSTLLTTSMELNNEGKNLEHFVTLKHEIGKYLTYIKAIQIYIVLSSNTCHNSVK